MGLLKFAAGFLAGVLTTLVAHAQINSWQVLQPGKGNYMARTGGLTPVFDVDFNSSVTPTRGTAGTYARTGVMYKPTGLSTLAQVAENVAPVGSFPTLSGESTLTTKGGIYHLGAIQNYLKYSDLFTPGAPVGNPWTAYGTGGALDPSVAGTLGPYNTGSNNAGAIFASAAAGGVYQDSNQTAGSNRFVFGVWLKSGSGNQTWKIYIEDEAGTPAYAEATCAVTETWQYFTVAKSFSGATGTVIVSIEAQASSLVFAWGAGLYGWNFSSGSDMRADFNQLPYIPTTTAAASLGNASLSYAGSEITTSRDELTVLAWIYSPTPTYIATQKRLWTLRDAGGDFAYAEWLNASGTYRVLYPDAGSTIQNGSSNANLNAWNHYAVAFKSGDSQQVLNGASVGTSAVTWTPGALTGLYVAQNQTPSSQYTLGAWIGRIQIYAKRLTADEIAAIYNSQKGGYGL